VANRHLQQLVGERRAAVVPGVYSALTTRQVELAGFEAVYVSGAGIANSLLAVPDLGLTSLKEVVDQVNYITEAVSIPVIVDADTGFGNALSVRRIVRAFQRRYAPHPLRIAGVS
jgi:2-methylisocitrate lyase-like PEP mutase family enzyme